MGNGQSTSSGTKVLAKVARGDVRAAQQVEEARAGYFHTSKGRRAALAVAAERGNCQLLASVYEAAEQAKGSWQTRQDFLNAPGSKGQTLLMTSCCKGHLECVTYLLSKGADVMATNPKGETCLHIAAKNAHSGCVVRLLSSRINTPGAATRLADLVFTEGLEEVKYVDLHNLAGMTALHVAALNGTAATVQAVLASGASLDAQITGTNLTPWLSRGSTALHIAAARGFHAIVDVLLAAQTPESGLDLRRMRNHRGLKPFQLARANGHTSIARQLCDTRTSRARRERGSRHTDGGGGGDTRQASTPEALLTMLIQRAKLLLTLKAMSSAPAKGVSGGMSLLAICTNGQAQESRVEQAAAEVLECSEAWRKGSATAKPASSILRLLGALDELPAAAMLNAAHATEDRAKSNSSYASAAMVQAALNAMASSASADPMEASSTSLTPTTPLAAAVILQAALRSLTGSKKRSGGGHSRRSRQSLSRETLASSPRAPPSSHASLDTHGAVLVAGPVTPARGSATHTEAALATSRRALAMDESHPARKASPAPSIKALSPSQQHSQAGPTTPRTPHSPGTHAHTETATPSSKSPFFESQARPLAPTPHRLDHQSVPATPELASETGGHKADIGGNETIPDRKRQQPGARAKSKLYGLPSAEDIDALCDMDNPGQSHLNLNAAYEPAKANLHLAPSLTGTTANPYQEPADRPSSSNTVQNTHNIDTGGSSQQGPLTQPGQYTSSSTFGTPEAPVPHSQSFHPQSECDSSAYDEGASSTLIHSISNEEQIMQDMLEEDHDDGFYTNLDVQQHDREDEAHGNRVEQLNTMELHGILGQHGYKVPELAGEQEEAEESDADGEDGDGDEDLDDNDEDYEEDGISDKNLFKTLPSQRRGEGDEDEGLCSICMDRPLEAQISGCDHQMCLQCAYQMCARGLASPLCPFCRGPINTFQPVQK